MTVIRDQALLFQPEALGSLHLPNRLAVAPMTRVSATADGQATQHMARYYSAFAEGGFGLIVSEGIYTDRKFSQGYLQQPGLADGSHVTAWRNVTAQVHVAGGRIIAQLMHAGALSQGNPHVAAAAGPSAMRPIGRQLRPYRGEGLYRIPLAMSGDEIAAAVEGFAIAARHAQEAGFDGIEIHGANGYLLDQFLSEGVNQRSDGYGGTIHARLRLILEVIAAVRAAIGRDFPLGLRISQAKVNDPAYKWRGGETEAEEVFGALGKTSLDYIHTAEPVAWHGAFAENGSSLAHLAKKFAGLSVIANGGIANAETAIRQVASGDADIVALGRAALGDPAWPRHIYQGHPPHPFDQALLSPLANLASADAFREVVHQPIRA